MFIDEVARKDASFAAHLRVHPHPAFDVTGLEVIGRSFEAVFDEGHVVRPPFRAAWIEARLSPDPVDAMGVLVHDLPLKDETITGMDADLVRLLEPGISDSGLRVEITINKLTQYVVGLDGGNSSVIGKAVGTQVRAASASGAAGWFMLDLWSKNNYTGARDHQIPIGAQRTGTAIVPYDDEYKPLRYSGPVDAGTTMVFNDGSGNFGLFLGSRYMAHAIEGPHAESYARAMQAKRILTIWYPFWTFAMLNCRNITTQLHEPSRDVAIRRAKQGKPPVTSYHTLVVSRPGVTVVKVGARDEKQDVMPLHLVRGNFATYTEDRPLFGRFTGKYWRPAHVRGNKKNGIANKDYEVVAAD